MSALRALGGATFASLTIPNFRTYFVGQAFSHVGNWMQTVTLGWLVLVLTGSGVQLGGVLAVRFAPLILLGLFAGHIVDSFDKRTILYTTQFAAAVVAFLLSALVYSDSITMWMVYVAAALFGLVDALDRPARQTFMHEMVGREHLRNAVTLNSTLVNVARSIGPLVAGVLIAGVGMAFCFLANGFSFLIFLAALTRIRGSELHREEHEQSDYHVLAGLRYAVSVPLIFTLLVSMGIIGTFAFEFQASLPLIAHTTFLGGAADYAALLSAMGVGSVVGGLFSASRKMVGVHEFVLWAFLFGVSICLAAVMPTLGLMIVALIFVGFFSICLSSTGNTMVQLESAPHMRGRVMSLWIMALFGSTLIGAPIIGFIGEHISPRWALAAGGVAALIAAYIANRRFLTGYRFLTIPAFISIRRDEMTAEETKV